MAVTRTRKFVARPAPPPDAVEGRVSALHIALYSMPFFAISVMLMPVAVLASNVYVKERGVSLAVMGVVVTAARVFDAFADQTVGYISDITRNRLPGGRKAWLVMGALLSSVATWALFNPPLSAGIVWFAVSSLFAYLAWAMLLIPYFAWGAELSRGYHARTQITFARMVSGQAGGFAQLAVPLVLAGVGVLATTAITLESLHYVGILLIVVLPLTIVPAILFVPQGVKAAAGAPASPWAAVRAVGSNKPMLIYSGALLVSELGYGMLVAAILFYLDSYLGLATKFSQVIMASTVAMIISLPVWERVAKVMNKRTVVAIGWAVQGVTLLSLALVRPGEHALFWVTAIMSFNSFFNGVAMISHSIIGDVVDYDTLKTGGYRAGNFFALYTLVDKMVVALGSGLGLVLLGLFHYDVKTPHMNDPTANLGMLAVVAIIPGVLRLVSLVLLWRYPLDAHRQGIVRRRLEQREARAARDAASTPKEIQS
jgi:GPH family glycoside/pentoside/hexuronide:cation symporter